MRRSKLPKLSLLFSLLLGSLASLAWSQEPGRTTGETWDDRHMRSNFDNYLEGGSRRPPIRGADRYQQIAEDNAPTPTTSVPELTLKVSQHEWRQGFAGAGPGASGLSLGSATSPSPALTSRATRSSSIRGSSIAPHRSHRR